MRLLNLKTGLVEEVLNPLGYRYAILSHMWEDEEVSFTDITTLSGKQKTGYKKISMVCQLAAKAGLGYVWIDTCCIDKSSSAELTEAINSMYRWYERSEICYAYLSDLPSYLPLTISLRHSRWFTRGWTLQELIAPKRIDFFDKNWNRRGSKEDLVEELSQITKINKHILGHVRPLSAVPVAQKMSWAAGRKTTRIEDQAYCLLGIFDVHMPLLYGEEERAFQRLQHEIIGRTADLSIFAWFLPPPFPGGAVRDNERIYCGLLAASPDAFAGCNSLLPRPNRIHREFSVSNYGIRTKISVLSHEIIARRSYFYVLPIDCVVDSDTMLGIRLRKCGPDLFVREDPRTLIQFKQSLLPNVPRARHLLTELSEPDIEKDMYGMYSSKKFAEMRPHVLQIQIPPKFEIYDAWPWGRYDDEDNVFLVSGEQRDDCGVIRLIGAIEVPSDEPHTTTVDIDYTFYVLGWIPLDFASLQYSFVDYRNYKAAVNEVHSQLNTGYHSRNQLLSILANEGIPRYQEAAKKIPGMNMSVILSVKPTLCHDTSICPDDNFWRLTFSCKIYKDEDIPDIQPLKWAFTDWQGGYNIN
ncbi:HET-domain-containing protein [Xylariaceae sp. FL1651]|nr:HET-domain-containing protein [Xylariaceae sp. FL1651]